MTDHGPEIRQAIATVAEAVATWAGRLGFDAHDAELALEFGSDEGHLLATFGGMELAVGSFELPRDFTPELHDRLLGAARHAIGAAVTRQTMEGIVASARRHLRLIEGGRAEAA